MVRTIALEDDTTAETVLSSSELDGPGLEIRGIMEASDRAPLSIDLLAVTSGRNSRVLSGDVKLEAGTVREETVDGEVELGLGGIPWAELECIA